MHTHACRSVQSPNVDVVKKDDDLWSPRHSHWGSMHGPSMGLSSESAFLSHFLPAPGNHPPPIQQPSTSTLRADLHRHRLPAGGPLPPPHACMQGAAGLTSI